MVIAEIKPTLRLAFPIVTSLLAQVAMEFVDVMMLGRLGANALAAGGLATSVYFIVYIFTVGLVLSVGVFVSRGFGTKDQALIIRSVQAGLWIAFFSSLGSMAIIFFTENILLLIKQPSTISLLAGDYARAVVWGIPAVLGFLVLREYVTAMSMPRVVMLISIAAIPANVLFNIIFMYGKLGFPALGIAGVGWATTLVDWMMFGAMIGYTLYHTKLRQHNYWQEIWKINWQHLTQMFKVGFPIGVNLLHKLSTLIKNKFG